VRLVHAVSQVEGRHRRRCHCHASQRRLPGRRGATASSTGCTGRRHCMLVTWTAERRVALRGEGLPGQVARTGRTYARA
jgi:hypothetical protein